MKFKSIEPKLIFLLLLFLGETVIPLAQITSGKKSDGKFTIIGLPDTQYYTAHIKGGNNTTFKAQTGWIVDNKDTLNIVHVCHFGDCVQNGDNGGNDIQWKRADTAMSIIEDPATTNLPEGISYTMNVGNHDQSPNNNPDGTTNFYNQYFGINRFTGRTYWGGNYGTNADNNFQLFSVGGYDFIVISLEFDPTPDVAVLNWADSLLQVYSNRNAIIVSHYLLTLFGDFGVQGAAIYEALKNNTNLFLMLCGHINWEAARSDTFNNHVIHTLLADYQERSNGGDGWMRIMTFDPENNTIEVKTYSPTLDQYETDAQSEFTLTDIQLIESSTIIKPIQSLEKIKVYPNPAAQVLTISLGLEKNVPVKINLIDITGRQIQLKDELTISSGKHLINIDIEKLRLANGMYWLEISVNNEVSRYNLLLN